MRKPDEIMAEYLLKGGKMLSKPCPTCGSPMFTYKGKTFCVVCNENEQEKNTDPVQSMDEKTKSDQNNDSHPITGRLGPEIEDTMITLLTQIRKEQDANRVEQLMKAVRLGAESYALINQRYEKRESS